jgi:5-methylcytosine-specific restriction endonuclease McrBC regulatory subunit McrC
MSPENVIRVPERGYKDIDQATWYALAEDPGFWHLVDKEIIRVSHPTSRGARLHGSCYVGRAVISDVILELHEKVDGAVASLLGFAARESFRVEKAESTVSELGDLAALIVRHFLDSIDEYVSRGRGFRYATTNTVSSLVGGKIDVTRTVRLRARGLRHLIAFKRNVLSFNTPVNRIILAAIREIGRLAKLVDIPVADLARSRGLAMLFDDCRDVEVLFGRHESFARQAQEEMLKSRDPHLRDLLALAGVILAHESFDQTDEHLGTLPRAWFLNLETLFETAVKRVLQDICSGRFSVVHGRELGPRIFDEQSAAHRAFPDIVLRRALCVPVAVGDVKYKEWTRDAEQGDLYQLLVHAATFGAELAFLVYPHSSFASRFLGRGSTGAKTWLFALDLRKLDQDLGQVLAMMGIELGKLAAVAPVVVEN